MTEPLAYYLLTDAGLADGTPAGVSAAMEAGEDVSPLLLKELGDGARGTSLRGAGREHPDLRPADQKVRPRPGPPGCRCWN